MAWGLGYKLSQRDDIGDFQWIKPDALQGLSVWLNIGDASKPTLVIPHALLGLPIGKAFLPHLPPDMPVMALQAPDLIKECSISTVSERAEYYCKILVSQFEGRNPSVHLLGYSFGGPLAYEMALCLEDSPVNCKSVCLIDPVPICNSPCPEIPKHQMP